MSFIFLLGSSQVIKWNIKVLSSSTFQPWPKSYPEQVYIGIKQKLTKHGRTKAICLDNTTFRNNYIPAYINRFYNVGVVWYFNFYLGYLIFCLHWKHLYNDWPVPFLFKFFLLPQHYNIIKTLKYFKNFIRFGYVD